MSDQPKGPSNPSQSRVPKNSADASRVVKPAAAGGKLPLSETAKATDSVPSADGPFRVLPVKFGRYEIQKELGRGQMGAVYLALDTELDRLVALKVARVSSSGSAMLLKRMEVEAKAAAILDHPLICKVYDKGEIDGIRFIAMQYVEGEDVKQYLKRVGRRQKPKDAVDFVIQILKALEAAHEKGIIHRDLKPENVMLNKKRQPVIMDFGLARRTIGAADAGLTQGMIVGTAAYMSPEQASGKADQIDRRTDIYAVGVMLFEMLTGEWPFSGSAFEVIGRKSVLAPPSPLDLCPELPRDLADVCLKMISQKKEDRYANCEEVVSELERYVESLSNTSVSTSNAFDFVTSADPLVPKVNRQAKAKPGSSLNMVLSAKRWLTTFGNSWIRHLNSRRTLVVAATLICAFAVAWQLRFARSETEGMLHVVNRTECVDVTLGDALVPRTAEGRSLSLRPGKHSLHLRIGEYQFDTEDFGLRSGEQTTITVTLVDGDVLIHLGEKEFARRRLPRIALPAKMPGEERELVPGMAFHWCPAGEFVMGSPVAERNRRSDESQVSVTLQSGFWLAETEVTQGQWQELMNSTPWRGRPNVREDRNCPVSYVTHGGLDKGASDVDSALEYCRRLTEREREKGRLTAGWKYTLPTESQWEYAARAGTKSIYCFGDDYDRLNDYCWWGSKFGVGTLEPHAHSVGAKEPNNWGFRDIQGNVSEWCIDSYQIRLQGGVDPTIQSNADHDCIARGGNWLLDASALRVASRGHYPRGERFPEVGFRVAAVRDASMQPLQPPSDDPPKVTESKIQYFHSPNSRWRSERGELIQDTWENDCEIVFGDTEWHDYDFTVQVQPVSGSGEIGLTFRRTADGYVEYTIGRYDRALQSVKAFEQSHVIESLQKQWTALETGHWYELMVRVRGTHCECFRDRERVFVFELPKTCQGAVGLWTSGTRVRYRDIRITTPDNEVLFEGLPVVSEAGNTWPPFAPTSTDATSVSMINNRDLTGWSSAGPSSAWKVENGVIFGKGSEAGILVYDTDVSDFELTGEVMSEAKGNGGIFFRASNVANAGKSMVDGFEFQVAGSDGDPVCKTGGLYHNTGISAIVKVNPAIAVDREWSRIRLKVQGRRIQGWVDGQATFDQEVKGQNILGKKIALQVQSRGGIVGYRNLSLRQISPDAPRIAETGHLESLFNGKDLSGWSVDGGEKTQWSVAAGEIVGYSKSYHTRSYLLSDVDYKDFVLRFDFLVEGTAAHGGVAIHAIPGESVPFQSGDLIFDHPIIKLCHATYKREETGSSHWVASRNMGIPPAATVELSEKAWNTLEVKVQRQQCQAWMGGTKITDLSLEQSQTNNGSFTAGLLRASGKIGFQINTGTLRLRNILIKKID